ncbi:MAG: hypothetical protein ACOYMA_20225 [Bacteroidia bacterium]
MERIRLHKEFVEAQNWLNSNGYLKDEVIQTNGKSEIKLTFIKHNDVENHILIGADIINLTIRLYGRLINQ